MNPRRLGLIAALSAGLFLLAFLSVQRCFQHTGELQNQWTVRRIQKALLPLLERANRSKDDLALQNTIQTFSDIPGMSLLCVTNSEGKIIANQQPSQIGQSFQPSNFRRGSWTFSLYDGTTRWGTVLFTFADKPLKRRIARQEEVTAFACFMLWLVFISFAAAMEKRSAQYRKQLADLTWLQEEQNQKLLRLHRQQDETLRLGERRLRSAIERIPVPTLFLDQRQRVAAMNRPLLKISNLVDETAWIGQSWQDIPLLQSCGPSLERSLQAPGEIMEVQESTPLGRLILQTPWDLGQSIVGTWVTLVEFEL